MWNIWDGFGFRRIKNRTKAKLNRLSRRGIARDWVGRVSWNSSLVYCLHELKTVQTENESQNSDIKHVASTNVANMILKTIGFSRSKVRKTLATRVDQKIKYLHASLEMFVCLFFSCVCKCAILGSLSASQWDLKSYRKLFQCC